MISPRALTLALFGLAAAAPTHAYAQLPTPREFASGLDLECYRTPGPALNISLALTHLNPVLRDLGLPAHQVILRELAQTCVPVAKNGVLPPPPARPFVANTDFACYRIDAAPLPEPVPLDLTHLNPVLANLPEHVVRLVRPAQLCVPVAKNNVAPPPAIRQLVQYLDLECWEVDEGPHPPFAVWLSQLNPQLQNIPPHFMNLAPSPRQLCVPVQKGNQNIPAPIRNIIQWVDLEKFSANPNVIIAPTNVLLRHLNPLFIELNLPPVPVILEVANALMVPVAKNGEIPPND